MESSPSISNEIWTLFCEMSPYLLIGFLLAGLLHVFVPQNLYKRYLGDNTWKSVLWAALFGIPLPLCSCGVIPTAMGLRRQGASKGATVSFLIATPQTGIDSIISTYSLMGLPFAILRPLAALITAIFGGWLCMEHKGKDSICTPYTEREKKVKNFAGKISEALYYGFVEMMQDIGKWLVIGLLIAGIITAYVPNSWFTIFQDNSVYSILFVLLFSIPMYLCATGSIPIAVALMLKGLTPGAALVLLMAGPASNAASILVIRKVLGRKTMLTYLASIIVGAVLFGLAIDFLLPAEWFTSSLSAAKTCCENESLWFKQLCSWTIITLLINAFYFHRHQHSHANEQGTTHTISIVGMHCSHCATHVEKAIAEIEGIENVHVDLESQTATIVGEYDKEAVKKAVQSIGFEIKEENGL